jgi:DNA topoisomerase-2
MTDEFKVLTDRDHVLLRPGMYCGSIICEPHSGIINYEYQTKNIVSALIKIIEEIVQNSLDEHIRTQGKFANIISTSISNTLDGVEITITDNGRGIPVEKIGDSYRPVLAWSTLRAGSNFNDAERLGVGTNGVGSALTNIFSTSFEGKTSDGKHTLTLKCKNNMSDIKFTVIKSNAKGTSVTFVPDIERFGLTEFTQDHIDIINDRLVNFAILYPGIQFSFNGTKIVFKNLKQIASKFHTSAVSYTNEKNIAFVFGPSGESEELRILSYVNGIYVKNGGSHIDFVLNRIIENLRESIKKKYKIEVSPGQIKQHLLFASWLTGFSALVFDSQTKERITNSNSEVAAFFSDIDFEKLAKQILNTEAIIEPMIAAILYKKELAEKLALSKKQKSVAKLRVVNHIAAVDPNPENRRIFLVEGASALGPHIAVRNPKTDGGYPLKGKILNVRGMKPVDILKNKEISELLSIIGLEFGKPAMNLNYGKIILFSDLDFDGSHIFGLLLNLFSNWPELFTQGRIYRCLAPLYYCVKGKDIKSFYFKEEFEKFNSKGYEVQFFKGLGSMPKEVYKECLHNSRLIKVTANQTDYGKLEMFFGDNAEGRKEWMTQ